MKIATWDVTAALLLTAVALCVTWVLKRRHQQQLFQRYGIPGPKPDFFFGNWMQLKKDRLKVMEKWIEEYGKVFGFYEGEVPKVVISDLEIIKKCFVKDSHVFRDRGPFVVEVEPIKSSLLFLKGDEWKRMRSVLNPIFSTAKMKLMSQVMSDCANTLVEVISHQLSTGRAVVNATELSQGLSLDVVTKCALAWQVSWLSEDQHPLLANLARRIAATTGLSLESAELYQVANYGLGGHYTPHPDAKDFGDLADEAIAERPDGNRLATMLLFLSDVSIGGATAFVDPPMAVKPRIGKALFWFNLRPYEGDDRPRHFDFWHEKKILDTRTWHTGCPVLRGSKWIATKWIHERGNIHVDYDVPV